MKKRSRVLAAAAVPGLLIGAVAISDQASAGVGDTILTPGPATLTVNSGGFINIGGNEIPLPSTATPVQCDDNVNNDVAVDDPLVAQDLLIDNDGGGVGAKDPQCGSVADDSEIKPGIQARTYINMSGSVDADGNISVPQANITFPTFYVFSSQANGIIDVFPTPTGDASGTLDPATGKATINVDWQLRVVQAFLKVDCTAQIAMDLSTDLGDAANSGSIPVTPSNYDPATGDVTITGNNFAVNAFVPSNQKTGTTGNVAAGTAIFTDPNANFQAGTWSPTTPNNDVGKKIVIQGAGAGGAEYSGEILSVDSPTQVTLKTPPALPATTVTNASYYVSASTQFLCDTVGGGFGVVPGVGSVAGNNAAQLGVTSTPTFQTGIPSAAVSGTVTEQGSGNPAAGVYVTLMNENPAWTIAGSDVTDASGNYSFDSVPDGNYQIRFWDPQGRYKRTWYNAKETYLTGDVVTVTGGASAPADQALAAMPTGKISGRFQTAAAVGKAGVNVNVYTAADGFYATAVTGADGYYTLYGVPDGSYLVQFVDPSATYPKQQWYNYKALAFNADPVVVSGGGTTWASGMIGQ